MAEVPRPRLSYLRTLPRLSLRDARQIAARIASFVFAWAGLPVVGVLAAVAGLSYLNAPAELRPPFDDSYISLVFARNLAEHGILTLDSVNWSTGATSPLHVAILALIINQGGDPIQAGLWAGIGAHVALSLSVYLLTWSIFRSRLGAFLAGACIAFIHYTAFDAVNGLETSLFMALVSASIAPSASAKPVGFGRSAASSSASAFSPGQRGPSSCRRFFSIAGWTASATSHFYALCATRCCSACPASSPWAALPSSRYP